MSGVERVMASFIVGPKGRAVLPASVRRAAGIEVGDLVVAQAFSDGRVVLETSRSIESRVWAHAPGEPGPDAVEDVRRLRTEDVLVSDEADRRRAADGSDDGGTDEVGAGLLAQLGL